MLENPLASSQERERLACVTKAWACPAARMAASGSPAVRLPARMRWAALPAEWQAVIGAGSPCPQ